MTVFKVKTTGSLENRDASYFKSNSYQFNKYLGSGVGKYGYYSNHGGQITPTTYAHRHQVLEASVVPAFYVDKKRWVGSPKMSTFH